ncbi:hypothetical protein SUDANB120_03047 [Streptomyces sp. enrichment culture]
MARIPVLVKPTDNYITGTGGAPKIKNPETGEIATDRDTGETLYTVTVMQSRTAAPRSSRSPCRSPVSRWVWRRASWSVRWS